MSVNRYIIVKVTAKHIRDGEQFRSKCAQCPIANAINDALGTTLVWRVGNNSFWPTENPYAQFTLPRPAREFIQDFDSRREVHPFTFKIPSAVLDAKTTRTP